MNEEDLLKIPTEEPSPAKLVTTSAMEEALKLKEYLRKNVVTKQPDNTFVRAKKIKGKVYYYLVRSVRVGGKIKQVTLKYLGVRPPRGWK